MTDSFPFFFKQCCLLSISFIVLLLFFPIGGKIDLMLSQPWINDQGLFFLKHSWALEVLNHQYVKHLIIFCDVLFFLAWLASFKIPKYRSTRWQNGYFFMMVILSVSIIGILKAHSSHSCPWDLTVVSDTGISWNFIKGSGHCFPGGHASSGFALMVGYFIFRLSDPPRAYFYLTAGIILGFAMGWAQMMRGAHFISHNLWTAWIIWALNLVIYRVTYHHFVSQIVHNEFNSSPICNSKFKT
ncbi:phosphatase PAP2 family protein [Acinetobacter shaoyimingii]|uniref:Phosphatase PAP2 family protein n=1 Tax=Acinetobacter shaoyimingii TaxID=2715164 RepID=A0A6G8RVC2_9GAMM|nr:phosphatase PAP2 family protein [Acinetobacter shaoyimingii]QIO05827.1 phosphatase PAP2 family protein [Acinetobacter shaoyimingii]